MQKKSKKTKSKKKSFIKKKNVSSGVRLRAAAVIAPAERLEKLEKLVRVISRGKYQWEATFDAITAPVMIVSEGYVIERANLAFAHHCGVPITEVPGSTCYEIFAGRSAPCDGCPLTRAIDAHERVSAELAHRVRTREFEASSYPVVTGQNGSEGAVMYYRDITEEKRLHQEVVQQEKMAAIGMLAGGVAHEINNPLGGILAFTQLLLRDARAQSNNVLEADLKEIENAAVRCKKIVQDLLDFSRVSKDRELCSVDINALLRNVVPFINGEIKALNVDLKLATPEEVPHVRGIPDKLQQVFLNLMTNACHAMPKGGTLTIATAADEDARVVHITVEDTGEGIPREVRDKIFDPFFTTKKPGKGTGLGLSISYRIIKEHDGAIAVESEVGKGSRFTISLPAEKE